MPRVEKYSVCFRLPPSVDLPPWQFTGPVAIRSAFRFGYTLDRSRVMLRVNALIEAVILHPGIFAGLLKRDCAVGAADRAAEGLGPVVHVAQLANKQPRVAPAYVTPDPERTEGLAQCAEAVGYATERTDHAARLEPRNGQRRINVFCLQCWQVPVGTLELNASLRPMQFNEVLARQIVAAVARVTADRPKGWIMLHQVARHLKVDEASAEAAMRAAIASGWLNAEGCSLYRGCLTDVGRALPLPQLP
jgi:hypothetical protein